MDAHHIYDRLFSRGKNHSIHSLDQTSWIIDQRLNSLLASKDKLCTYTRLLENLRITLKKEFLPFLHGQRNATIGIINIYIIDIILTTDFFTGNHKGSGRGGIRYWKTLATQGTPLSVGNTLTQRVSTITFRECFDWSNWLIQFEKCSVICEIINKDHYSQIVELKKRTVIIRE